MSLAFGLGFPHWQSLSGGFTPASLFAAGEQGAWYDPSDFSTLFQDSAGTTPVTAVEQPVGLMLDKSKGLVLGSELLPAFPSYSVVLTGTWAASGGNWVFTDTIGGQARPGVSSLIVPAAGWYKAQIVIAAVTGATNVRIDGIGATDQLLGVGTHTFYFLGTGSGQIRVRLEKTTTAINDGFALTSFSIKALSGNHAFQSTPTSRPTLSSRVNLLTKTEEFDDAAWVKNGVTVTANAIANPVNGAVDADLVIPNTGNIFHFVRQTPAGLGAATYKLSCYAKAGGYDYIEFHIDDTGGQKIAIVVNLTNGAVTATSGSATATVLSNGWYYITSTGTTTTAPTLVQFNPANGTTQGTFAGNGTSGVYIWGADLRVANDGATLPVYQRVDTATSYDTAGFPLYLRFDGSDDSFLTNSVNFSTGATNAPLGPELANASVLDIRPATGGTVTRSGGIITFVSPTSGLSTGISEQITVEVGKFYIFKGRMRRTSGTNAVSGQLRTSSGGGGSISVISANIGADWTDFSLIWLATSTTTNPTFFAGNAGGVSQTIEVDEAAYSFRELDALYAPDRMSVFAGLRKLSDTAEAVVAELSATIASNNGTFRLAAPHAAATSSYEFESKGTTMRDAIGDNFGAPTTNVISGLANISGDSVSIRVNSALEEVDTGDQGTGNFGNFPLYIGRRNNTNLPFNGRMYSLIILGRGVTPQQLDQIENYVEQKTFGRALTLTYVDPILTADLEQITMPDGEEIFMSVTYQ
jgi:hypothetical protein